MSEPAEIADNPLESHGLLRRRDQPLLACVALIAVVAVFCWWGPPVSSSGRLTEWGLLPNHGSDFRVNINTATWPELTQVPEIGGTLARRIVENRRLEGPFHAPEDLTRVHGIGVKTLESMQPYLSPASWSHGTSQGTSGPP